MVTCVPNPSIGEIEICEVMSLSGKTSLGYLVSSRLARDLVSKSKANITLPMTTKDEIVLWSL